MNCKFPIVIKPLKGSGGRGIRLVDYPKEADEQIVHLLKREENLRNGLFIEEFLPFAHHIEIPFFRDAGGNILFLPEIESSIQRRFQKLFQESPSVNVTPEMREAMYRDGEKLVSGIGYVGLGYIEFIVVRGQRFFFEINPTFQINTLIPEVHLTQNFLKKQFSISRGEPLHHVDGVRIVEPRHHVLLVSLMAEDPFRNFQPSCGQVTDFFHYSTIRNIFKTVVIHRRPGVADLRSVHRQDPDLRLRTGKYDPRHAQVSRQHHHPGDPDQPDIPEATAGKRTPAAAGKPSIDFLHLKL